VDLNPTNQKTTMHCFWKRAGGRQYTGFTQ